ncbi:MAG TPA: hypothetical protein P5509_01620 [Bacteroidales bacterium]|nr:hypothetical protein [Bacteroidales bacterium]
MNTTFKETINKVLSSKKTRNLIFMNGKYHDVEMYEHIQAIQKVANPELYSFIQELWEDVNAAEESCNALADMGEHPEWYHYKIARDTAELNII